MVLSRPLLAVAACCLAASASSAQSLKLTFRSQGAMPIMGGYMPIRLTLSADKPASVRKMPRNITAPLFGELKLGSSGNKQTFAVVVDEPDGKDSRLFVDSNGNGDLTDDPPTKWEKRAYPGQNGQQYSQYMGGATVNVRYGSTTLPMHLGMYRFDKSDTGRAALKSTLLYYADYAYEGEAELGGAAYKVMLADRMATGDFSSKAAAGTAAPQGMGLQLMIDVNRNGRFDSRGEMYDAAQPFNIKGTTYELRGLSAGAGGAKIAKSAKAVAEILPPPDLGAGKKAVAFTAKTTNGQTVDFPSGFKGKLVMLDFWATWCGPCVGELPHLTAAYAKYHDKGFEVLGISLDQQNALEKLTSFTKEKNMPWSQVYDGKYWQAEVAQLYVIQSIPAAFLVDGDTGVIVASGNDLRGEALADTIDKALAAKHK